MLCTGDMHLGRRSSRVSVENDDLSVGCVWEQFVEAELGQGGRCGADWDNVNSKNQRYKVSGFLERGVQIPAEGGVGGVAVVRSHDHDASLHFVRRVDLRDTY